MKIKPKTLFISIAFVITLFVVVSLYFLQGSTSFNKIVSEQISLTDVNQIKITRLSYETLNREEVTISEPDKINLILNSLNTMKLTKIQTLDVQESQYKYDLIIRVNQEDRFGISFFDENTLEIYDAKKTKNRLSRYKIKNDYNINDEITGLIGITP
ncbi:TPA: hypothetical protein KN023_003652 [Clostridioides difficile]|nr:hypothetical protein [Clostridioides difficile]